MDRNSFYILACLMWICSGLCSVNAFATGPRDSECGMQVPGHGFNAQDGEAPYDITTDVNEFTRGTEVTVTISSTGGATFRGFLITARNTFNDEEFVGSFIDIDSENQNLLCDSSGVSHSINEDKESATFTWKAPEDSFNGNLVFRVTVVQTEPVYWVNLESEMISNGDLAPDATAPPTTTIGPVENVTSLSSCGDTIGCFRTPRNCEENDCDMFVSWVPLTEGRTTVSFQMRVKRSSGWVALGFSDDAEMGDDYVLMCLGGDDNPTPISTFNQGRTNGPLNPRALGLSNRRGTEEDGMLTCTVEREVSIDGADDFFDISRKYTLFLGNGPVKNDAQDQHEAFPLISAAKVSVSSEAIDVQDEPIDVLLVKLHGIFMISAWMMLISISLFLARFYKPAFPGKTLCNKQIWFTMHVIMNITALLLTITAFVLIFVEVEGYTKIADTEKKYLKSHPILGIIVTALAILNPIMAIFRPHPDAKNRPIFNWAHWGVGTIAHIASIITIFFGFDMPRARLFIDDADRGWVRYVLGAFCAWHLLAFLILEILRCRMATDNRESEMKREMEMMAPGYKATENNGTGSNTQSLDAHYIILPIYVLGTLGAFGAILYGIITGEQDSG